MVRKILLILVILLLVGIYLMEEINKKRNFKWDYDFSGISKQPYGCFVIRDILGKDETLPVSRSFNKSFYEFFNASGNLSNTTLLIITEEFNPDSLELASLFKFVDSGNQVFLSAYDYGKKFSDSLRFSTSIDLDILTSQMDSVNLYNPRLKISRDIQYGKAEARVFSKVDTLHHEILGYGRKKGVNYIRIKYGKGLFYVHCQPLAFSNFHMLYTNDQYPLRVLSYFKGTNMLWDDYYKPPAGKYALEANTPFRYLLSEDSLRMALYLTLVLIFIWFLIESKRKQRAIPIFEPPVNATLGFVKTIARLYQGKPDYKNMALRKFQYFKEMIYSRYNLRINEQDVMAASGFSERTGYDQEKTKVILDMFLKIEKSGKIDADTLILFSKKIDEVYHFESMNNKK